VTKVYSHAQSLAQCVQWLAKHLPGVPRVAVASNAEAARLAATEPGAAAIAGENARRSTTSAFSRRTSRTSRTTRRASGCSVATTSRRRAATRRRW
jgi:prephenate dehydratase